MVRLLGRERLAGPPSLVEETHLLFGKAPTPLQDALRALDQLAISEFAAQRVAFEQARQQPSRAVGGFELTLQELVLHLQCVQFPLHAQIVLARIAQREVCLHEPDGAAAQTG